MMSKKRAKIKKSSHNSMNTRVISCLSTESVSKDTDNVMPNENFLSNNDSNTLLSSFSDNNLAFINSFINTLDEYFNIVDNCVGKIQSEIKISPDSDDCCKNSLSFKRNLLQNWANKIREKYINLTSDKSQKENNNFTVTNNSMSQKEDFSPNKNSFNVLKPESEDSFNDRKLDNLCSKHTQTNCNSEISPFSDIVLEPQKTEDSCMTSHELSNISFNSSNSTENSKKPKLKLSRIIIFNIMDQCSYTAILQAIYNITMRTVPVFSLIKICPSKHQGSFNYIIDIPPDIANLLLCHNKIMFNDKNHYIKRYIFVKRCFKCQDFGHIAKFCKRNTVCAICSNAHDSTQCNNPPQCINCNIFNRTHNKHFKTNHPTFSTTCKSFQLYIQCKRDSMS